MAWKLAVGNLISRAPAAPAASGASPDPLYPLTDLGNGHPDDPGRLLRETDGAYAITFDLNLLAASSSRIDAPTGWADLANRLAGTPGLPAFPPEQGTFAARANSLKFYGPVYQDVEVMPGEDLLFAGGIYRPSASAVTAVQVVVIDLATGKQWDGVASAWNNSTDPLAAQATDDTWLDVSRTITNASDERTTYRVILVPVGGSGSTFYAYASDPGLAAEQDFVAVIGNNIPAGSTMTWADGTVTATLTPAYPSFSATFTASTKRAWTLSIAMPTNQKDFTAAPYIGELWSGRLVDMVACPGFPFDIIEGDIAQVRLEGGLGRESVFTETERPTRAFKLKFTATNDAQYEDARDSFLRATRYGADPLILVPIDALEGVGTLWHGRIGPETTFSRISNRKRTFEVNLRESPFPRFR